MKKLKKKVYLIGGRPKLVVYGDIAPVFESVELRPSCLSHHPEENSAIRIYFFGGAFAGNVPFDIPHSAKTVADSEEVLIKSSGARFYGEWYSRAFTVVDTDKKLAFIFLPGLRDLNVDFVSRFIFRPVLDTLLYESGYVPLHASGIVSDGGGCIIAGPAGTGKSSLLHGLIEKGYGFVADDRILIKKDRSGGLWMHTFPEYIRLANTAYGPKHLVEPSAAQSVKVPVRYVFLLGVSNEIGDVGIHAVGKAEAAARLMHSVSSNLGSAPKKPAFEIIGDICSSASAFTVTGWGNPEDTVRKVSGVISGGKMKADSGN